MFFAKSVFTFARVWKIDSTFDETSSSRFGSMIPSLSALKNFSLLSALIPSGFMILIFSETRKCSAVNRSGTNFKNSGCLEYLKVNEFRIMANFISIMSASKIEM
jgi:hypothetical protein